MKRFFSLFLCLTFLALTAGLALAVGDAPAAATAQAAPQAVSQLLVTTVFPVLGSFVLGLLSLLIAAMKKKYHLEAVDADNRILMQVASQGIAFAEEKAASLIGSKAQLTGNQKLDTAITYICNALPKVTPEQAQSAAHAMLAMTPGIGATAAASFVPYTTGPSAAAVAGDPETAS